MSRTLTKQSPLEAAVREVPPGPLYMNGIPHALIRGVLVPLVRRVSALRDAIMVGGVPHSFYGGKLRPLIAGGAYDAVISRTDAAALIPEEVAREIIKALPEQSAALALMRRINMSTKVRRTPALSAFPVAYWVEGDTGLKQLTSAAWKSVYMTAEELACICPVPDNVIEDADYPIWSEIEPLLREAIARAFDAAIFFGTDKPASWPEAIVPGAVAAGNTVTRGTAAASGGVAEDFNLLMAAVEADGFDVNGFVTARTFRRFLRGARDADGQKIADVQQNTIEGVPVRYAMTGLWPVTTNSDVEVIAGDFTQAIVGVRRDITIDRSSEAVITDSDGNIVFNLWQQDMTAVRVTFRGAFAVANPLTRANATEATRYPFAVMMGPDETP